MRSSYFTLNRKWHSLIYDWAWPNSSCLHLFLSNFMRELTHMFDSVLCDCRYCAQRWDS
ncbi:hypothetical protein RchiOBHm_Chr2g0165671 [Rosa chinensis]|uniref:Uncharacterized protein n=1 Tax=Rosa chinensis TaxID=74649 RepID=A0A2P6S3V7_ROSCH|nr:hypothetical protein RchiOBHm_Chr2g0165671 [Rosa chinensis]